MNGNDCIEFEEQHHETLMNEFVMNNQVLFGRFLKGVDEETLKAQLLKPDKDELIEQFIEAHPDEYHEYVNQEASEAQAWEETKWDLMNNH